MDRLIADGPIQSLRRTWPSPDDRFISHSFRWSYLLRNNNPQFLFPKLLNPHFQRFLTDSPLIAGAKDLIWICEQEDNSENSFITALFTSQLQPSPLLSFQQSLSTALESLGTSGLQGLRFNCKGMFEFHLPGIFRADTGAQSIFPCTFMT